MIHKKVEEGIAIEEMPFVSADDERQPVSCTPAGLTDSSGAIVKLNALELKEIIIRMHSNSNAQAARVVLPGYLFKCMRRGYPGRRARVH